MQATSTHQTLRRAGCAAGLVGIIPRRFCAARLSGGGAIIRCCCDRLLPALLWHAQPLVKHTPLGNEGQ